VAFQSYQSYGIDRDWMSGLKKKAKDPTNKERIKELADGVTKQDLQNREKVERLIHQGMRIIGEKPTARQIEQLTQFIIDQKIDPQNMFHLIKMWGMLR